MSNTEQVSFFLVPTWKVPQNHKTDFCEEQVILIDILNDFLRDLEDEVEGFDDCEHAEPILDLVLASHGWEWEEYQEKYIDP